MYSKSILRKAIALSLVCAGVALMPVLSDAASPNRSAANYAEFHQAGSALGEVQAENIVVLPINNAKFWAGQKFDFETEIHGKNITSVSVTVDGEAGDKYFKSPVKVTQQDGYVSYRLDDIRMNEPGQKIVKVEATVDGAKQTRTLKYNVVEEKAQRKAKNVILYIGDGMSMQAKQIGRILSKGITEGKYNDLLDMEKLPNMALISTSGYDSIVTDSANSASAYNTGHKSVVNAMGVYANSTKDPFDDPKVENINEIVQRSRGMAVGIVSTAAITDATPAAVATHTRRRAEQPYIAKDFANDYHRPQVILGGGAQFFLPKETPGSRRKDNDNVIQDFKKLGYQFVGNKTELLASKSDQPILGLFQMNNMEVYMDREFRPNPAVTKGFNDQPNLMQMTQKALDILDKDKNGFFLMVEGGSIDKQLHTMDWQRATYDTIEFDKAVELGKKYSAANGDDTLIIVVADHAHGVSITGTYSEKDGKVGREAVRVYGEAGWPTFVDNNGDGFPDNPDADVTLAVQYANAPDHYENYRFQDRPTDPALKGSDGKVHANPNRAPQGARLVEGNLPTADETSEVHSADDVVLMAGGPGSEYFHGVMDNTEVFFGILRALGIKATK